MGNQDGGVRLFDVRTGAKVAENTGAHTGAVTSVAFSRNDAGARLLTASRDNTLRLLDGRTLEGLRAFLPPSAALAAAAAGSGGSAAGGGGGASVSGPSVASMLDRLRAAEGAAGLGGDGMGGSFASSSGGGGGGSSSSLSGGGAIVMRHSGFRLSINTAHAVFSPSGHFAVAGSATGCLYAWNTDTGTFDGEFGGSRAGARPHRERSTAGEPGTLLGASPGGSGGGGSGGGGGGGSAATAAYAELMGDLDRGPHAGAAIYAIDYSADGRFLASGDEKGVVVVWTTD